MNKIIKERVNKLKIAWWIVELYIEKKQFEIFNPKRESGFILALGKSAISWHHVSASSDHQNRKIHPPRNFCFSNISNQPGNITTNTYDKKNYWPCYHDFSRICEFASGSSSVESELRSDEKNDLEVRSSTNPFISYWNGWMGHGFILACIQCWVRFRFSCLGLYQYSEHWHQVMLSMDGLDWIWGRIQPIRIPC